MTAIEIEVRPATAGFAAKLDRALTPAVNSIKTKFEGASRDATKAFDRTGDKIADSLKNIDVDRVFDQITDGLDDVASDAADILRREFDDVGDDVGRKVGDDLGDSLRRELSDAADTAQRSFDGVADGIGDQFDDVRFADRFRDEAKDAARKAVKAFDGAKGRIADVFRDAARLSGQALQTGFRQLGRVGVAAFAGLATATVGATTAFTEYDAGIREVYTLLGESPPTAVLDGIDAQVKSLATTYGVDLADAVTGAYDAISAGVDPSDTAGFQAFTDNAAKFAQAGATDFGTSVDLLTTSINSFGLEASETGRVADILFAGIKGGKCIRGDQRVLLADGSYRRIDELSDGAEVLSWDGERLVAMPATWVDQGVKKTVTIRTKSGRSIVTTPEHPYLTPSGWRRVDELSVGDKVGVPCALPMSGSTSVPEHKSGLLGLWLAEGASDLIRGRSVRLTTSDYGDDVQRWARGWGQHVNQIEKREGLAPTYRISGDGRYHRWNPNPLLDWLREAVADGEKVVPDEVFTWDRESLATMLRWLFNGDGWLVERRPANYELGFCSNSERLVRDVSHLLLRFGIAGTIRHRPKVNAWVWQTRRYNRVKSFVDQIGIDRPASQTVLDVAPTRTINEPGPLLFDPITEITVGPAEHVYDLCVPGFRNFVAEDVVAHNTTADQLGASLFQVAPIAASTGVNLETTTAALASLTAQGVPTAQAATQIKAAFSELGKEGTKASTAFTDLTGVGFREFLAKGGSVQNGLDLLAEGAAESGLTVADLFGSVEAGQAVLGLTGDQAERFADNLDSIANSAGATDAAFETMQGSLRATLDRLRQTFRVGLVNLGEQLEPIITPVLAGIADRLPSVFENITGLVTGAAEVIAPFVESAVAGLDTVLERVASFDVGELFGQVDATGFADSVSEIREAFDGIDFASIGDALTRIGGAVADLAPEFLTIGTAISSGGFQVLEDLAPVIAELAVVALPPLVGLVSKLAAGFTALTSAIPGEVLAGLVISFKAINTALAVNAALTAAGGLVGYLKNIKLVTTATRVWAGVQRLLNLSLLANPIGIAVAAVAALAAGIVIAYKNSETFRNIIGRVGDALGPVIDAVKTVGSAFGDLFQGDFSGFGQTITEGFGDLGGALADLGRAALTKLSDLFSSGEAGRLGTALRDKIGDGLQALGGLLADVGRAALGVLSDFFTGEAGTSLGASLREKLLEGIGDLAGFIGDKIGELVDNLPAILSAVGAGLVAAGQALAGFLLDALSAALTGLGVPPETVDSIIGGLTRGLELAGQAIGVAFDVISTVVSVGVDVVSLIIKGAAALWDTGILQTIWDGLSAAWDVAFTIIKAVVSGAINFIGGLISGAKAIWDTGLLQTVWDGISAVWEGVFSTLETIVGGVIDAVGGLISGAKDVWDTVSLGGIWDGLTDLWDGSFDLITEAVEGFIDTVGGVIGKASEVWGKAADGIGGFFGGLFGGGEDPSEQAAGALSGIAEALGGANFDVSSITNIWGEVTAAWSADLGELETLTVTAIATISATIAGAGASLDVSGLSDVWTRPAISWRRDLSDLASTVTTGIAVVAGAIRSAEGRWDTTNLSTTWDGLARGWAASLTRLGTVVSTSVGNIAGIITGARAQWNVAQLATIWSPLNASWQAQLAGLAVTVAGGITRIAGTISGAPAALNVASMESVFTSVAPAWAGSLATANGSVASGMAAVGSSVVAALAQLRSQATAAMTGTVAAMIAPLLAAVGRFGAAATAAAAAILRPFRTLRAQLSGLLNGVSLGSINVGTVLNQLNSVTNAANRASRAVSTATRNASRSRTVSRTSTRSTVRFRSFAEGGLADEPSIFGEDGPELALPFTKPNRMRILLSQFSKRIAESVGGTNELQTLMFGQPTTATPGTSSRAKPAAPTGVGQLPQRILPPPSTPAFLASTPPRSGSYDQASPIDREAIAAAVAEGVRRAIEQADLGQTIHVTTQPGRDLRADLALTDQRP